MSPRPKNRRLLRNYFPDPEFQFKFLRFVLLTSLVPVVVTVVALGYFIHENYQILIELAGVDEPVRRTLYQELFALIVGIGSVFSVYLVAVLVLGVVFSHRVGGALYAVRRTIRDINSGKQAQLELREKDEFQGLVSDFNTMVATLRAEAIQKRTGT